MPLILKDSDADRGDGFGGIYCQLAFDIWTLIEDDSNPWFLRTAMFSFT